MNIVEQLGNPVDVTTIGRKSNADRWLPFLLFFLPLWSNKLLISLQSDVTICFGETILTISKVNSNLIYTYIENLDKNEAA